MAELLRVKARWLGFSGAPGFSVFHFRTGLDGLGNAENAEGAAGAVRAFFGGMTGFLPAGVSIQIEQDVEGILEDTGELTNVYSAGTQAIVNGAASTTATYAAAAGAIVNWQTGGIRNGRRVRGKTFLVPLSSGAFAADGTLSSAFVTQVGTASNSLRSGFTPAPLGVYCRPSAKGASDGVFHFTSAYRIPDKVCVLRSRRD